jgi:hypothetical protein
MTNVYKGYILLMAVLFFTPLRAVALLIMPFFLLALYHIQKYRFHKQVSILVFLFAISSIINLLQGNTTVANILLSSWITLPSIVLFFSSPVKIKKDIYSTFKFFLNSALYVLILIDILGEYYYYFINNGPDALGFSYGTHFNGVHGLAVLNILMCFFFASKVLNEKKIDKNFLYSIFFFISFILCSFGLGLISMVLSIALYVIFQFNIKSFVFCFLLFIAGTWFMNKYFQNQFEHVQSNINTIEERRKIIVFINYINFVRDNPILSLIGTGPGGYNSKSAFLLNVDSDNPFTKSLGHQMPPFHQSDAYPLWNKNVVSYEGHTDGTTNQPFSSLISIFAEYGIIFGLIFIYFYIENIIIMFKNKGKHYLFLFLSLGDIFMFMLLITNTLLESTEFLYYVIFRFLSMAVLIQTLNIKNINMKKENFL